MHHGFQPATPAHRRRAFTRSLASAALSTVLLLSLVNSATAAPTPEPRATATRAHSGTATPSPAPSQSTLPSQRTLTPPATEPLPDGETAGDPATVRNAVGHIGATMRSNADRKRLAVQPTAGPQPEPEALTAPDHPDAPVTGNGPVSSSGLSRMAPAAFSTGHWRPSFGVPGQDVSAWQGTVNWAAQWSLGSRFAYVKASEGSYYTNANFASQYNGSANQGMVRGAYHFAIPSWSSGADQARYFASNGGGWSSDGITLPPVLDIEYNPYQGRTDLGYNSGDTCYSLAGAPMVRWITDFGTTMKQLTGRYPVIYTTTDWWTRCTGNSAAFSDYPLWIAAYPSSASNTPGTLPASWQQYSLWQYSDEGPFVGDSNVWNGDQAGLTRFATGRDDSRGAIVNKWLATGGASGPLGAAKSTADICGLVNGGCYRPYANGNIYWSPATGAYPVTGAFWTAWGQAKWQAGIGYPTSDVTCPSGDAASTTCHQTFQQGNIYSTPKVGTFAVTSAYMPAWKNAGWQYGLGYPKGNVTCGLYGNGCYQPFTQGNIYTSPSTTPQAVTGAYWNAWEEAGFQPNLGYPTGPVTCGLYGNGCYQPFTKGNIYAGPDTAPHAVTGAYWTAWQEAGFQPNLGYPTGPVTCGLYGNGCYQPFTKGNIYAGPDTAPHAVTGTYWNAWREVGFQPNLGYPTGPVTCGLYGNGCYQPFTKGNIYAGPDTAPHAVTGAYWTAWQQAGFQPNLGYPTGPVSCGLYKSGCYQPFTKGNVYSSPTSGAHAVTEPYRDAWRQAGWQMGKLGYPTGAAVAGLGYRTVPFEGGSMAWTTSGVKVSYR